MSKGELQCEDAARFLVAGKALARDASDEAGYSIEELISWVSGRHMRVTEAGPSSGNSFEGMVPDHCDERRPC